MSSKTIGEISKELLVKIFLKVPFSITPGRSFVSLRAVCKRWAEVVDSCWSEIKEIVIHDGLPRLTVNRTKDADGKNEALFVGTNNDEVTKRIAGGLIKHCGPHLKALVVSNRVKSTGVSILPLVAQYCPDLEVFFGDVSTPSDGILLKKVLEACTSLKVLKFTIHNGKVINYFEKIPANLEGLSIATNPHGKHTDDPKLMESIKSAVSKCQSLIQLKIDYVDRELLSSLGNLKELQIGHSDVLILMHDKLLIYMSKTCLQLEKLVLEKCVTVTDGGIAALSSLPKLKSLLLVNMPGVTGSSLKNFSNLFELAVSGCPVTDAAAIGLLKNCQGLFALSVDGTRITNNFLTFAVRETKRRTNDVPLIILCQNTRARPEQLRKTYPLCKIIG